MAFSNSASPEIIWGLGGPAEDHQLHHCCWTGRVSEREEEEEEEEVLLNPGVNRQYRTLYNYVELRLAVMKHSAVEEKGA